MKFSKLDKLENKENVFEYFEQLDEIDKVEMPVLIDTIEVWKTCVDKGLAEKLSEIEQIAKDSLELYWGKEAQIKFDVDKKEVRCSHRDGRLKIY